MFRRTPLAVLIGTSLLMLVSISLGDPPSAKSPTIEVIGLEVKRALSDEKEQLQSIGFPGTGVDVYIALPGKHIICYDADASKLDSFVDDLGTDLTKPQPGRKTGGASVQPSLQQLSQDGGKCRLVLRGAAVPGKNAKTVTIKGKLVLKCGADERTVQSEEIDPPGRDEKIVIGKYTLSGGFTSFGDQISLTFESQTANVKDITVFGPDYKEVKQPFGGLTLRPGTFGDGKYHQFLSIPKPKGKVTVRVAFFNEVEDVAVPLNLTVGLGL